MIDLSLHRVSKRYRIAARGLREPTRAFWALRDVSFDVRRGEALGIVGRNGAGKSTLLKLLSGITAPTEGRIEIVGRVSAMIEVGSSFHPELTGRENVFLNGALLGMRRAEIRAKLDRIVEFAGIGDFLDTPVKRYSSGMYVRLGFSIAAHLEPDVLLLDEVLAVGDAAFQAKCLRRIDELHASGATIVFISHDLAAVEALCERALLLDAGRVVLEGRPHDVTTNYQGHAGFVPPRPVEMDVETVEVRLRSLTVHDAGGAAVATAHTAEPLRLRIEFDARRAVEDVEFQIDVLGADGRIHCELTTALDGRRLDVPAGAGVVEFALGELGLLPGVYLAQAMARRRGEYEELDWRLESAPFRVEGARAYAGRFHAPHTWTIERVGAARVAGADVEISEGTR